MKLLFLVLAIIFYTESNVQSETFKSPDILVASKLDYDWSVVLISKYRQFLKNYNLSDPFSAKIEEAFLVNESKFNEFLPPSSKKFINTIGNALGLGFFNAKTEFWLHGLSYDVSGFKTDLKSSQQLADGVVIETDLYAEKLKLKADKITLSLQLPGREGVTLFSVDILNPSIDFTDHHLIHMYAKVKLQDEKNNFTLKLLDSDFSKLAQNLIKHSKDINIKYDRIIIPETSVKVGEKVITFYPDKIEKLIRDNHEAINGFLLIQAADLLKNNSYQATSKLFDLFKLEKEYWIASSVLQSQLKINKFSTDLDAQGLSLDMPGDFCPLSAYEKFNSSCVEKKITQTSDTRLKASNHHSSLKIMNNLVNENEANIVASVSEDYINKLLVATYDAGLWKDALDEAGVTLGPSKVIMRLNKKGDSGTLFMDVIYSPSKITGLLMGTKEVRFPLVLDLSLRIENHDQLPVVIIRLNGVDDSEQTLRFGKPEEGLFSNIQSIPRFKKKIISTIRKSLAGLNDKDIIELRYPELSGLSLDKVDFLSDGHGRMNALMRLEDVLEVE